MALTRFQIQGFLTSTAVRRAWGRSAETLCAKPVDAWRRDKSDQTDPDAWKKELKKGYFDDFGDFKKHRGKLFEAARDVSAPKASKPFPVTQFMDPDANLVKFPRETTSLACISFREGAREMTRVWIEAFRDLCPPENCFRISVIEHKVMSLWPLRNLILASGRGDLTTQHLFHFGDSRQLCTELEITNRLTAYVFLVDRQRRIRWRATGMPTTEEIQILKHCYGALENDTPL